MGKTLLRRKSKGTLAVSGVLSVNVKRAKKIVNALLPALGVVGVVSSGVLGLISVFAFKILCFHHDERQLEEIDKYIKELSERRKRAEKGTLIDFSNEQNLWGLCQKTENWLDTRYSEKRKLLRRVALTGVIKGKFSDEMERNFKFAINTIEMEDIEILRQLKEVGMSNYHTDTSVLADITEGMYKTLEELGDNANFKCGRLQSAGLIRVGPTITTETEKPLTRVDITLEGNKFLEYLQSVEENYKRYSSA